MNWTGFSWWNEIKTKHLKAQPRACTLCWYTAEYLLISVGLCIRPILINVKEGSALCSDNVYTERHVCFAGWFLRGLLALR